MNNIGTYIFMNKKDCKQKLVWIVDLIMLEDHLNVCILAPCGIRYRTVHT